MNCPARLREPGAQAPACSVGHELTPVRWRPANVPSPSVSGESNLYVQEARVIFSAVVFFL